MKNKKENKNMKNFVNNLLNFYSDFFKYSLYRF